MVKVNGKMVPFFAADGKGSGDLKKAMYGMKMKSMAGGGGVYPKEQGVDRTGRIKRLHNRRDRVEDRAFRSESDKKYERLMDRSDRLTEKMREERRKREMGEGGKVYKYMEGGEIYQIMENGGPIRGMDSLQGRFRVIPEPADPNRKDSPIEYKFYVDGEEMTSTDFTSALREADPNADINEIVKNSAKSAGLRWDDADGKWFYTGSGKDFRMNVGRGMEERKAFEEGGPDAVRDIYRDREESLRRREMAGRLNYMRTQ